MELRHLRHFVTVAEELNFSKAALKLYTAQPSLSQQIKDLEQHVGVQLLYRTKRKVELTEEGTVFLQQARLTLAQADKAIAMARQVLHAKQQTLRLGFIPVAEIKVFPALLPNLRMQNPDLKIELLSLNNTEQLRLLKKGDLDITFTYCNLNNERIESLFVLPEPLIFVLPRNHPLTHYEKIPVQALNGIDFIIPAAEQASTLHHTILEFAKVHQLEFNIVQKAEHLSSNIDCLANGLGCSIVPSYLVPLMGEHCVIRALEVELPNINLYVNYHKNHAAVMVKKCIALLARIFSQQSYCA